MRREQDAPQVALFRAREDPGLPIPLAEPRVRGFRFYDVLDGTTYEAGATGDEDDCFCARHYGLSAVQRCSRVDWTGKLSGEGVMAACKGRSRSVKESSFIADQFRPSSSARATVRPSTNIVSISNNRDEDGDMPSQISVQAVKTSTMNSSFRAYWSGAPQLFKLRAFSDHFASSSTSRLPIQTLRMHGNVSEWEPSKEWASENIAGLHLRKAAS